MSIVPVEQSLAHYEGIIERGRQTFIEVGTALMAIREDRLYREQGWDTFEEYCRERWGWSASRSRQLIGAAEVAQSVTTVTLPPPVNERQTRELNRIADPEVRREAWKETSAEYGENATAAQVAAKVDEKLPPKQPTVIESFRPISPLGRAAQHYIDTGRQPAPPEPRKPLLSEMTIPASALDRVKSDVPDEEVRFKKIFGALMALDDVDAEEWAEEVVARGSVRELELRLESIVPWLEQLQAALRKHHQRPMSLAR